MEVVQLCATYLAVATAVFTLGASVGVAAAATAATSFTSVGGALAVAEGSLLITSGAMEIDQAGDERAIEELRSGSKNTGTTNTKIGDNLKHSLSTESSIKSADVESRKKMGISHNMRY